MSELWNWFDFVDQQYHQGPNFLPSVSSVIQSASPFLVAKGLQHLKSSHQLHHTVQKKRQSWLLFSLRRAKKNKNKKKPFFPQILQKISSNISLTCIIGPFLKFPLDRTIVCIDWLRPGLLEPITETWGMDLPWLGYMCGAPPPEAGSEINSTPFKLYDC